MALKAPILWTFTFICWISNVNICGAEGPVFFHSLQDLSFLPEEDYINCGDFGSISDLLISGCEHVPCYLKPEGGFTLEYAFIAVGDIIQLDFDLNVIDRMTGEKYNIRHIRSVERVEAGVKYESFVRVSLNSSVPVNKSLYMEILRSFEGKSICAWIPTVISSDSSTTTTTADTTQTTPSLSTISDDSTSSDTKPVSSTSSVSTVSSSSSSSSTTPSSSSGTSQYTSPATISISTVSSVDSTTSSGCPEFSCEREGLFPDPCDCAVYHTCQRLLDGSFWDQAMRCPEPLVWCEKIFNCDYSSSCPC